MAEENPGFPFDGRRGAAAQLLAERMWRRRRLSVSTVIKEEDEDEEEARWQQVRAKMAARRGLQAQ